MLQLVYLLKRCHFLASQSSALLLPRRTKTPRPLKRWQDHPLPSTVRVMGAIQTLSRPLVRLERREDWVAPDERFGADA